VADLEETNGPLGLDQESHPLQEPTADDPIQLFLPQHPTHRQTAAQPPAALASRIKAAWTGQRCVGGMPRISAEDLYAARAMRGYCFGQEYKLSAELKSLKVRTN